MAVTLMLLPSFTVFAASSNEISDTAPTITLSATITDDITGEKVSVPAKIITSQVSKELGTEFTEEATAIFSFSQPNIKKQIRRSRKLMSKQQSRLAMTVLGIRFGLTV